MAEEIVNRVAQSKLITFNLEDFYPQGERIVFDLSQWLHEGFVLRETQFREQAKDHDWSKYGNAYVALGCSTDAIVPAWAYMLISSYLQPFAKKTVIGSLEDLESHLYLDIVERLDVSDLSDKAVIVKGCSNNPET